MNQLTHISINSDFFFCFLDSICLPIRHSIRLHQQLTFCKELSVEEKLTYLPHPQEANQTLLKQEAVITVHGIPLSSYIEEILTKTISTNADKGRQAMEFVIGKLNTEMQGISRSMDDLKAHVRRSIQEQSLEVKEIEIPRPHFTFSTPES